MQYKLNIYRYTDEHAGHEVIAEYTSDTPPWVPREGEFVRFQDHHPPQRAAADHRQWSGWVDDVVTVWYGSFTVIEVYFRPRETFQEQGRPAGKVRWWTPEPDESEASS